MLSWLKVRRNRSPAKTAGQREAEKALVGEDRKLAKTETETSAILEAAGTLKRLGESNDFAARIKHALGE